MKVTILNSETELTLRRPGGYLALNSPEKLSAPSFVYFFWSTVDGAEYDFPTWSLWKNANLRESALKIS